MFAPQTSKHTLSPVLVVDSPHLKFNFQLTTITFDSVLIINADGTLFDR